MNSTDILLLDVVHWTIMIEDGIDVLLQVSTSFVPALQHSKSRIVDNEPSSPLLGERTHREAVGPLHFPLAGLWSKSAGCSPTQLGCVDSRLDLAASTRNELDDPIGELCYAVHCALS